LERTNEMCPQLFFTNVPYNCSDRELKEWIESRGIDAVAVRIIRDLVSGVSPAFAYASLKDEAQIDVAISALNGKKMRNQIIAVSQAPSRDAVA
jgi:RNA recognition motif-containing protein